MSFGCGSLHRKPVREPHCPNEWFPHWGVSSRPASGLPCGGQTTADDARRLASAIPSYPAAARTHSIRAETLPDSFRISSSCFTRD